MEGEVSRYHLIRYYAQKWVVLVVAVIVGLSAGFLYVFLQHPTYKSSATFVLVNAPKGGVERSIAVTNYTNLFTSRRVLQTAAERNNYIGDYTTLRDNTTVKNIKNTDIVTATVVSSDPTVSHNVLQTAIEELQTQATSLYGDTAAKIKVVDQPSQSNSSANISPVISISLFTVIIVLIAVVGLFVAYDYQSSRTIRKTH